MATPTIDLTLLGFLLPIFTFLLVFALGYALILKTNILGEKPNKVIALVVALSLGALATFAGRAHTILELAIPWMALLLVVGIIIFSFYGFLGVEEKRVWNMIGRPVIVLLVATIFIISIIMTYDDILGSAGEGETKTVIDGGEAIDVVSDGGSGNKFADSAVAALVHPRVFGAIILLIIAAATAKLLADKIKTGQ
jgi:hypothetical protein